MKITRIMLVTAIIAAAIAIASTMPIPAHADVEDGPISVTFPQCGDTLCVLPKSAVAALFRRAHEADEAEAQVVRLQKAGPKCAKVDVQKL